MASFKTALSEEGFRSDGRRPNELRQVRYKLGVYRQPDGSAYLEQGNTKVLATVYGPHAIRGHRQSGRQDTAIINCQFSMAVFSTLERKSRPRGDKISVEITRHLQQTFSSAILTSTYPQSQIDIYVEVLQSDGSVFSVCVNAATLAVIDAGIAMNDVVCAATASDMIYTRGNGSVAVVDVTTLEQMSTTLTVAYMPKLDKIVQFELTGRVHTDRFQDLMSVACKGCEDMRIILERAVREYIQTFASSVESAG